jgi:dTDP-4-dehydrorhamnose reductase
MEKELSYAVNVEATKNIAGICSDYRIPLAFTSTDLVFDGLKGNYSEEDEKNPVSEYGNQKAIAEEEVLKIYPEATVFRLPLMFGHPQASTSNYLQKFITQLQNEEEVNLFTDEFRSVCGAKSISAGILQLIGHSGIIHLAGTERLSRYEFGLKAATAFQLPISLVQPCLQKEMKMAAPRPPDVSLNITKALNLGYNPLQVDEELKMIASGSYL